VGDESAVDEDGDHADRDEDARVLEGVADAGHLEEVGAVGLPKTSAIYY
jgi:hypothetical protein